MGFGAEIQIDGLDEFIDKIDTPGEVKEALERGIKKVIFFAEGEAKVFTPVDTGFLRNSYKQAFGNLTGKIFIRNYGFYVHEGTRFIRANPFMTNAVEKNQNEFNLIMNEELQDNLSILQ